VKQSAHIRVSVSRWESDDFPGWVECEFRDASGARHTFIRKNIEFSDYDKLRKDAEYPISTLWECRVLADQQGDFGDTVTIMTQWPSVETEQEVFVVLSAIISA